MIPKQTHPLVKSIRSLEGILVLASDIVLAVASLPSIHAISPAVAAACGTASTIALVVQRGVLKVRALGFVQVLDSLAAAAPSLTGAEVPPMTNQTPAQVWSDQQHV